MNLLDKRFPADLEHIKEEFDEYKPVGFLANLDRNLMSSENQRFKVSWNNSFKGINYFLNNMYKSKIDFFEAKEKIIIDSEFASNEWAIKHNNIRVVKYKVEDTKMLITFFSYTKNVCFWTTYEFKKTFSNKLIFVYTESILNKKPIDKMSPKGRLSISKFKREFKKRFREFLIPNLEKGLIENEDKI